MHYFWSYEKKTFCINKTFCIVYVTFPGFLFDLRIYLHSFHSIWKPSSITLQREDILKWKCGSGILIMLRGISWCRGVLKTNDCHLWLQVLIWILPVLPVMPVFLERHTHVPDLLQAQDISAVFLLHRFNKATDFSNPGKLRNTSTDYYNLFLSKAVYDPVSLC